MHFHTSGKIAWLRDVIIKIHTTPPYSWRQVGFMYDPLLSRFRFRYLLLYLPSTGVKKSLTISQNTCAWMISLLRTWFLLFLLRWEGWLVIQVSSIIITNCQIQLSGSPTNAISTDVIFYYSIFCHFMHKWEKIPKCRTFCKGLLTWFDSMYHIQL